MIQVTQYNKTMYIEYIRDLGCYTRPICIKLANLLIEDKTNIFI